MNVHYFYNENSIKRFEIESENWTYSTYFHYSVWEQGFCRKTELTCQGSDDSWLKGGEFIDGVNRKLLKGGGFEGVY